ncbi:hypothetical protein CRE_12803 [Caenorhabditis remanei]|uniref:Uncharacterized protein n=1 Tax=Caenorhabditis remanei TaxID=31234 RepID=E3M7Y7_CAERE|nr:hypothetical protein CRE_12803 [Caenorhabditis remanei]
MSSQRSFQEMYQPPARRSGGGSSNGETPPRNNRPPPFEPINCCGESEDSFVDSPAKSTTNSLRPSNSNSSNWRERPELDVKRTSLDLSITDKCNIGRQKHNSSRRIPVVTRTAGQSRSNSSLEQERNESYVKEENFNVQYEMTLRKYHSTDVPYIDSHCHTDFIFNMLHRKYPENHVGITDWVDKYPAAFPKSFAGFIANFIKPGLFVNDTESSEYDMEWILRELEESSLYIGTTWGCHPHQAETWWKKGTFWTTLDHILSNVSKYKVLAVGECGIDLHRCESSLESQKVVFDKHVALAYKHKLPLVVHCRNGKQGNSEDECLKILKEQMEKNHPFLKIHRHCYTENWSTAQRWLKQCPDVHFGFTGAVLSFNEGQIEAIRRIPLDRILLETDGPYFKPKCFERIAPSKVCLPGMAIATAERLAEIKNVPLEEILRATYNNARRVYQVPVF